MQQDTLDKAIERYAYMVDYFLLSNKLWAPVLKPFVILLKKTASLLQWVDGIWHSQEIGHFFVTLSELVFAMTQTLSMIIHQIRK